MPLSPTFLHKVIPTIPTFGSERAHLGIDQHGARLLGKTRFSEGELKIKEPRLGKMECLKAAVLRRQVAVFQ